MKNKELKEGQYGEWLKGVSGRFSNRIGSGRDMQKMAEVNRGAEKEISQAREGFFTGDSGKEGVQKRAETGEQLTVRAGKGKLGLDGRQVERVGTTHSTWEVVGDSSRGSTEENCGKCSKSDAIVGRDSGSEFPSEGEPMDLVDILVLNGANRLPLANITNLGSSLRPTGTKQGGRKWRRQAPNKADKIGTGDLSKGQTGIEGSKRRWSLRDVSDDEKETEVGNDKRRRTILDNQNTTQQVGVVSLN